MSTTTASARAVRQTLEYQLYEPGKGHQIFMTWTPQYAGTLTTPLLFAVASMMIIVIEYTEFWNYGSSTLYVCELS
jgi:hypothetical protein